MTRITSFLILILLLSLEAAADEAAPPVFQQKSIAGAVDYFDVVYLPHRQSGDDWRNRWVTLNIHVPKDTPGARPCIVFVHGGGYGAGDKDGRYGGAGGIERSLLEQAVAEGFVAVNLNYVLSGPSSDGIFPQVWIDYKNAIRFLRTNAEKYRIDPARIGGWGFSAGGWLSGSGSFTTADDTHHAPHIDPTADRSARRDRDQHLLLPLDDLHTPYPDQSSRVSALVADFWPKRHYQNYSADDPAVLTYVGQDAQHELVTCAESVGNEGVSLVLTNPKYKGQSSLHVPALDSPCRKLDGTGESVLRDEALSWLKSKLLKSPRMVPPEARPNQRVFADSTLVKLIAAAPGVRMHYTLDGSQPTNASPVYDQSLTINKSTTVKAIAAADGFGTSAVATFVFHKATPPPTLKKFVQLPTSTVGHPYSVKFETVEQGEFVWNMGGHFLPNVKMHPKIVAANLGLVLDQKTGVLAGTPTQAGAYTVTIQVARGWGQPANVRDYVLQINAKDE